MLYGGGAPCGQLVVHSGSQVWADRGLLVEETDILARRQAGQAAVHVRGTQSDAPEAEVGGACCASPAQKSRVMPSSSTLRKSRTAPSLGSHDPT